MPTFHLVNAMEHRDDYILDRSVYISDHRSERPHDYEPSNTQSDREPCVFCPGQEHRTPDDVGRVEDEDGNWLMRWFPNDFPAASPDQDGQSITGAQPSFISGRSAHGHHEVLDETPDHNQQMADRSEEELGSVLNVSTDRLDDLHDQSDVRAVTVFKNHGPDSGASIVHPHSQVIATPFVPELLRREISAVQEHENCPYCKVLSYERSHERSCFENDDFVAFTPYASRHEYELWFFPRAHTPSFHSCDTSGLAPLLKRALRRLQTKRAGYNYVLHDAPDHDAFHAHLELYPRTGSWGGFERGTDTMINPVPPEQAAAFYRQADDPC